MHINDINCWNYDVLEKVSQMGGPLTIPKPINKLTNPAMEEKKSLIFWRAVSLWEAQTWNHWPTNSEMMKAFFCYTQSAVTRWATNAAWRHCGCPSRSNMNGRNENRFGCNDNQTVSQSSRLEMQCLAQPHVQWITRPHTQGQRALGRILKKCWAEGTTAAFPRWMHWHGCAMMILHWGCEGCRWHILVFR